MQPEEFIEIQTLGGAKAAGMEKFVGSIEPNKRADIVIRAVDAPELGPGIDPVHQLIAVAHGPTADTVLVNGRIVMRKGRSTLLDEEAVVAGARASAKAVASRLGLRQPGNWTRS